FPASFLAIGYRLVGVDADFQRVQFTLTIARRQEHVRFGVVHLHDPARYFLDAGTLGGIGSLVSGDDLVLPVPRPDDERVHVREDAGFLQLVGDAGDHIIAVGKSRVVGMGDKIADGNPLQCSVHSVWSFLVVPTAVGRAAGAWFVTTQPR